jgi:putative phosphoesterase
MTTRIVVLADTHLPRGHALPPRLERAIETADLVIHLGDFTGVDLADRLDETGKLIAVHGNNDMQALRTRYPDRHDLEVEGHVVRCIHGDVGGRTATEAAAKERGADVVLYGHSHMPKILHQNGVLLFNPGSPTQKRFAPYRSYGILDIGEEVDARLVSIEG